MYLSEPSVGSVLLIDDSYLQLTTREKILRGAGVEVCSATSAESAMALLRGETGARIRAIVTDHVMPGRSGAEFVRQLREARPEVPVIVISGLPEAQSEYDGLNITFRQKPVPPEELIELVKRVLGPPKPAS